MRALLGRGKIPPMTQQGNAPSRAPGRKRKDVSIQALRGVAVILMVAGHVIGSDSSNGMTVADDSWWRYAYLALEDIRMPLFTVLSGFVYALRPPPAMGGMPNLLRGKARRLLVPLLIVGMALFAMRLVIPGTNKTPDLADIWRIPIFGSAHLWFLQSIFLIFVAVGLLDALGAISTRKRWAISTVVSFAIYVAIEVSEPWNVFSVNGAIDLLPFFLLGVGASRFRLFDTTMRAAVLGLAIGFTGIYALRAMVLFDQWTNLPKPVVEALSLAVGVLAIALIFSLREHISSRWLAWMGGFSFGIYLLHVFATAGSRIFMDRVGIDVTPLVFAVCLIAGVGLPIVFQLMFGRNNAVRVLVLGERPIDKQRSPAASGAG